MRKLNIVLLQVNKTPCLNPLLLLGINSACRAVLGLYFFRALNCFSDDHVGSNGQGDEINCCKAA
jgi:hypothetical protein